MSLLYRFLSFNEYNEIFENDILHPLHRDFISLTKNPDGLCEYIKCCAQYIISFDSDEVYRQGGIDIDYNYYFMYHHKSIYNHITSNTWLSDLIKSDKRTDILTEDEIIKFNIEIDHYFPEQEVVIHKLIINNNLIKDIVDLIND